MSKHTPTPWVAAKDSYGVPRIWSGTNDVASTAGDGSIESVEREANAEFIVRACNSYEDLMEVSARCLREFDRCTVFNADGSPFESLRSLLESIKATGA